MVLLESVQEKQQGLAVFPRWAAVYLWEAASRLG